MTSAIVFHFILLITVCHLATTCVVENYYVLESTISDRQLRWIKLAI